MKIVKLFMKDGHLTSLCNLLTVEQRKRMFRICRVLSKRQYNRMVRNWTFDETVEVHRYGKEEKDI